jgi:hypothetical protein
MSRKFTFYSALDCDEKDIKELKREIEEATRNPDYTIFTNYFVEVQTIEIPDEDDDPEVQFPLFVVGVEADKDDLEILRNTYEDAIKEKIGYLVTPLRIEIVQR